MPTRLAWSWIDDAQTMNGRPIAGCDTASLLPDFRIDPIKASEDFVRVQVRFRTRSSFFVCGHQMYLTSAWLWFEKLDPVRPAA